MTISVGEFLNPLKGQPAKEFCLAILYYAQAYEKKENLAVYEIRYLLKRARVKNASKINISDALSKLGHFVDSPCKKNGKFLWSITRAGLKYIKAKLGLQESEMEIEQDVSSLETITMSISNKEVSDYIQESIKCLRVGALRAAIVFLWSGAVRKIQEDAIKQGENKLNSAISKHDSGAKKVKKIDDLAYIKEKILILATMELGIFDKNQKDILEEALGLRNKCGHPGKYKPGVKKTSSFIEDIVSIVFS